jgi:hypothetical protein
MRSRTCKVQFLIAASLALAAFATTPVARADDVTDWNQHMLTALHTANVSPLVATRDGALVAASVFDALNGIDRRYESIHVPPPAYHLLVSRRAAVIQAAYGILVNLFPAQQADLDAKRVASLSGIAGAAAVDNSRFIQRGIKWGQHVADEIWAWRSTDGFTPAPPPYTGGLAPGQWRPTPPANLPGAGPQFATMTPWVMQSPSQFRPGGPPALDSADYAADFEETKVMGSLTSALRTADETVACNFWAASTVTYFWNSVAVSLSTARHASLSRNARLLAVLNLAIADAAIACWDAKYTYAFWRPVTAIPLADTDGNAATIADPLWAPLLTTPNHPEYPSGHSTASGAAAEVLAAHFGDNTPFTIDSDVLLGVTRSFPSFTEALEEVKTARIFAGIHFRSACNDGQATGIKAADNVMENAMQRFHRRGFDKDDKFDKGYGNSDKK